MWLNERKYDIIFLQETYCTVEVEDTWRTQWQGKLFSSHGTNHSCGVMVLVRSDLDFNLKSVEVDTQGRYVAMEAVVQGSDFLLVNIYAPNKVQEQCLFFDNLNNIIENFVVDNEQKIVIGGDFNIALDSDLDCSGGNPLKKDSVKCIQDLCLDYDLVDIWRIRNPETRRFTWRQKNPLIQRRLDYWLISDACQEDIEKPDIISSINSDHSAVFLHFNNIERQKHGPSFWKFNASLAEDINFVTLLNESMPTWLEEFKEISDKRVLWDLIKYRIRQASIKYGKDKARKRREKIADIEAALKTCEENCGRCPSLENLEQLEILKLEYNSIYENLAQGAIVRSRATWYEKGEKSNKYFLNLESYKKAKSSVRKVFNKDGILITNPKEILQEIENFYSANKIIFNFIWKGKDKIKRLALIGDIEDGGLKAPHLDSIIKTQRILCCKRLASEQPSSWKTILLHYLNPVGGKFILCCDYNIKTLPIKLPVFYEECLKYFAECSAAKQGSLQNPTNPDLSKIILWNNKAICVDGKSVYYNRLANIGILRIGDLIYEDNKLLTNHLRELNISPLDAFRIACVIDALPTEWRAFLKTCNHSVIEPFNLQNQVQLHLNGQNVLLGKAESKLIYKEIRNRSITPPTAQLKYNAQFASDELDWKKIYSLPHRVALDAKSREFQYKLLNRCLATNVLLSKIGIIPSSACSFCGEADESLEHLFVTCHYTKKFWAEVIKWMGNQDIEIEPLSNKDIMFGIMDCNRDLFVNHILLIAKKYIYSCRCNKTKPSIMVLNARIKMIHQLEMMVAKSCSKLPFHLKKWGKFTEN